jgi:hypothetical protein
MSPLEKLPTELLEKVFLYCMNLELPRSSPVIAGKLSSDVVYLHMITAAFGPTWEIWHAHGRFQSVKGNEQDSSSSASEDDHTLQVRQINQISTIPAICLLIFSRLFYAVVGHRFLVYSEQRKHGFGKMPRTESSSPIVRSPFKPLFECYLKINNFQTF